MSANKKSYGHFCITSSTVLVVHQNKKLFRNIPKVNGHTNQTQTSFIVIPICLRVYV